MLCCAQPSDSLCLLRQGPLEFAATSHRNDIGRHLGISADSERQIQRAVSAAGYAVNSEAFQLGKSAPFAAPHTELAEPCSQALSKSLQLSDRAPHHLTSCTTACSDSQLASGSVLCAGEVSFHSGWTFHRAEGNSTQHPRKVMTVIYMDKVRLLPASQLSRPEARC